MKEIKAMDKIYLEKYDVHVNPYLTYAQIQAIVNAVKQFNTWSARQQNIDMLVLHYATDIDKDELENYGHDHWLASGLIEEVENCVRNIVEVYNALKYEESPMRVIMQIAKEMPEFSKKVDEVMKNAKGKK